MSRFHSINGVSVEACIFVGTGSCNSGFECCSCDIWFHISSFNYGKEMERNCDFSKASIILDNNQALMSCCCLLLMFYLFSFVSQRLTAFTAQHLADDKLLRFCKLYCVGYAIPSFYTFAPLLGSSDQGSSSSSIKLSTTTVVFDQGLFVVFDQRLSTTTATTPAIRLQSKDLRL
ncbi:unnamed protein product [Ilex paraguariensis]|uniref:Uncharacterized protein n=1 Tax=Ilex paraguariensis TaxID=185542 RepID=A0ABC8SRL2_9AQUA